MLVLNISSVSVNLYKLWFREVPMSIGDFSVYNHEVGHKKELESLMLSFLIRGIVPYRYSVCLPIHK